MTSTATTEPSIAAPAAKPRLVYLDILRVLGAIAIVVIHVTDDGFSSMGDIGHREWLYCLTLDSAMRWAVPIFVMVSGFLLLNPSRTELPRDFFAKRFRRIGIPVATWSILYLIWRQYFGNEHLSVREMIVQGLTGSAAYHMWFVFMLAGLYLATPALRFFTRNAPVSLQRWTCLGLLALAGADSVMNQGANDPTVFVKFLPFIGYYIAGSAFAGVRISRATTAALCGAIVLCIVAMVAIAAPIAMHGGDDLSDAARADAAQWVLDEFSPLAIVMSLSVYVAASRLLSGVGDGPLSHIVTRHLAPATMGVYLVHPMVLDMLDNTGLGYTWHGVWIGVLARTAAAVVISFAAGLIPQRIPVIKATVGG